MRQVEKVDVGLHVACSEQFDAERFGGHFFLQLEVTLVGEVVSSPCLVVRCPSFLCGCFAGVLFKHILLGASDEFVLLFDFGFFRNLANTSVRVEYRFQFHI